MKEKLLTPAYCFIISANFLLYFGFYLLMPVLPFYLEEVFRVSTGRIGLILACYTIAALTVRPFSGFLLDTFARKPFYLLAYFVFTAIFAGYPVAGTLSVFIMLRIFHGFSFGMVSVAGNTIVIDVTPSSRRGEALGYYGLANNIAMAVGPMTGLFLHDHYSFDVIFTCAFISCGLGFIMAYSVRTPGKPPAEKPVLSLDRFILLRGVPVGAVLVLVSVPYGILAIYTAMYGKSIGISGGVGMFFTLMAAGTALSRLFSGKQVDRGRITQVITGGLILVCICYFVLASCARLMEWNPAVGRYAFFGTAFFLGLGFGSMFPAFNTMFVNLASHHQRATATSTYLTAWDVGVGLGLTLGGLIAEHSRFSTAYFFGDGLIALAIAVFCINTAPYFHRHKLR
jgi:MFS family permease